jgi:hypothetical protein
LWKETKQIYVLQPFNIFTACFPAAPKIINWVYCIFIVFGLLMKVQVFLLWHGMQNRLKTASVYHIWLEWEREKQCIEFFPNKKSRRSCHSPFDGNWTPLNKKSETRNSSQNLVSSLRCRNTWHSSLISDDVVITS